MYRSRHDLNFYSNIFVWFLFWVFVLIRFFAHWVCFSTIQSWARVFGNANWLPVKIGANKRVCIDICNDLMLLTSVFLLLFVCFSKIFSANCNQNHGFNQFLLADLSLPETMKLLNGENEKSNCSQVISFDSFWVDIHNMWTI